jgi:transposase
MAVKDKFVVQLTEEQRKQLTQLATTGTQAAATVRHARILLKAHEGWTDDQIASVLEISGNTVGRVRKRFAQQGFATALHRKKPTGRPYRKLDGAQEAQLVALACSPAPTGQAEWTMTLLADKLIELTVVESIDPSTVWRTLKKTKRNRG